MKPVRIGVIGLGNMGVGHAKDCLESDTTELVAVCEVNEVQIMLGAYEAARQDHPDLIFAAMFRQRTLGHWQKIRRRLSDGALGKLVRSSWISASGSLACQALCTGLRPLTSTTTLRWRMR